MVRDQLGDCPDPRVVAAMAELPRHWFVPAEIAAHAYDDCALAIGAEQTISQPRVVASMLAALHLAPGMTVLDVGAGSGYAATLIARLIAPGAVVAVERQKALVPATTQLLARIAPQVRLVHGDGLAGYAPGAPYDAVHVACACEVLPAALIAQLRAGARMVLPLGPHGGTQRLTALTCTTSGVEHDELGAVLFVPALPGTAE